MKTYHITTDIPAQNYTEYNLNQLKNSFHNLKKQASTIEKIDKNGDVYETGGNKVRVGLFNVGDDSAEHKKIQEYSSFAITFPEKYGFSVYDNLIDTLTNPKGKFANENIALVIGTKYLDAVVTAIEASENKVNIIPGNYKMD